MEYWLERDIAYLARMHTRTHKTIRIKYKYTIMYIERGNKLLHYGLFFPI